MHISSKELDKKRTKSLSKRAILVSPFIYKPSPGYNLPFSLPQPNLDLITKKKNET